MKLTVGYGEKVITPPLGIDLCGYGCYLDRRGESVLDDLKVRALFLRKDSSSIILISCDLIGFMVEFTDAVRGELAEEFNVPAENILLACIHTHSGPATSRLVSLGEIDQVYMDSLSPAIREAVGFAAADIGKAEFFYHTETIEPVGYNRRTNSFAPIDPALEVGIFKRSNKDIYMLSFPCHPVTLGQNKQISADWPGAVIQQLEARNNRAIFFQGLGGNIDPVTQMNRWGQGTKDDLCFYGGLVAERALKAERYAVPAKDTALRAIERRIRVPLAVPAKEEIGRERKTWMEREGAAFPNADRFFDEWAKRALERHAELSEKPYLENVPVQVISIGDLKIIALPGEVDCEYGLYLREKWSCLFTFGYAGGLIGYLPTRSAYQDPTDYACYKAPKFYNVFPFSEEIEEVFLSQCDNVLAAITQST